MRLELIHTCIDSPHLPSNDRQSWYYPGVAVDEDDERGDLPPGTANANWGKKDRHAARFVRRGHIAAWGPTRGEYDVSKSLYLDVANTESLYLPFRLKNALVKGCERFFQSSLANQSRPTQSFHIYGPLHLQ
jgi:hypothetical protein